MECFGVAVGGSGVVTGGFGVVTGGSGVVIGGSAVVVGHGPEVVLKKHILCQNSTPYLPGSNSAHLAP